MRTFVDTSAWVAFADRKDRRQSIARAAIEGTKGLLVTSTYVLDETVTLAAKRAGHANAVALGNYLRSSEVILHHVSPDDEAEAWKLFCKRKDKGYSFTDCTSFVLMRRLGIKDAVALDDDFEKEGFRVKP